MGELAKQRPMTTSGSASALELRNVPRQDQQQQPTSLSSFSTKKKEEDVVSRLGGTEARPRSTSALAAKQAGRVKVLEWCISKVDVGTEGKRKTLLRDINGRTESGEFTAIMGPSGAGKTTLIECLSLRNRNFLGALHLDGKHTSADYFTSAALVHQRELLFGFMTAKEHLYFHAVTKMSKLYTPSQMQARIKTVMRELNLEKCGDTLIGGTDALFTQKGLSGGERKRVIIATELLLCPSLLFLDEPTSGLDSVMAESVIHSLKELANREVMVMASIHSPTSEMVRLFTHMILLTADGRLAYHGRMVKALAHFGTLGHTLPKAHSPADFFLRLVSRSSLKSAKEEETKLTLLVEAWAKSPYNTMAKANLTPESAHRTFTGVHGRQVSNWQLWKLNVWRGMLQTRRDLTTFWLWGAAMTCLGLIFGFLFFQQADSNWRNLVGLLFSTVVAILFTAAIANMVKFPLEWSVVCREYMSGSNAMGPYIGAKIVYDLPFAYGPLLLATVLYWMTGMYVDGANFIVFALIIILVNQASVAIGLFISSFSPNPYVGLALIPAVIAPMIMFSGILYQRSNIPPWLSWLESLSIVNYGFSALMALQLPSLPRGFQMLIVSFTEVDPNGLGDSITMLIVMTVAAYALTYANLKLRLMFSSSNI